MSTSGDNLIVCGIAGGRRTTIFGASPGITGTPRARSQLRQAFVPGPRAP